MYETIAVVGCDRTIAPDFYRVFDLGLKIIEKEFETEIEYDVQFTGANAELRMVNANNQKWHWDLKVRDTIIYKLCTHFTICLGQF